MVKAPTKMTRPSDLPEFRHPPLREVVLGVQFRTPDGYQQIYAGKVWDLFRESYPKVEEHPSLQPTFETFGPQMAQAGLELITQASHDRFWFVSSDGFQLLQFQNDRLHHNWRKMESPDNEYPRFEVMVESFKRELEALQSFMRKFDKSALEINQCEVSYINIFDLEDIPRSKPSSWFRGFDLPKGGPENFRYSYTRNLEIGDSGPIGRLYVEAASALRKKSEPIVHLQLTARGAPVRQDVEGALQFLQQGRKMIVNEFAEITSERAQDKWERLQ